MAELRLLKVKNPFLKTIDLHVGEGEAFSVVGPSGAGKTSLLRVIAGLAAHKGRILLNEQEIQSLSPDRRSIGFVSQDLHLFPHLTLEGNIFLAMNHKEGKKTKHRRVEELMELLRVKHLAGRKPSTFSGGEKQRVALARALASNPRLLLLDEPFSKLDFRTARYLRSEFKHLQKELKLTTLIVTHNLEEAGDLANNNLAIMSAGSLRISRQHQDWAEPRKVEDDHFLEPLNIINCRMVSRLETGLIEMEWIGGRLLVPDDGRTVSSVAIKGREIEIGATPPPGPNVNRFSGVIDRYYVVDDAVRVVIRVKGTELYVEETGDEWREQQLAPGVAVHGYMKLKSLEIYPRIP